MSRPLRTRDSLSRLASLAGVCLLLSCARKDGAPGHGPTGPVVPSASSHTIANPQVLHDLTDAEKSASTQRVQLLGLTEPAKDMPQLRVKSARVALHGSFNEALWNHYDRLVIIDGVLRWAPIRAVPTTDDDGLAIQTRSHAGGWSLSEITSIRTPSVEELAGQVAWVEGIAIDGPSVRTERSVVGIEGRGEWQDGLRGQRVRVEGQLIARDGGMVIRHAASFPLKLALLAESEVEFAGRCWSMNDSWWFDWRGTRMTVEAAEGVWPPRHLPGGGHGTLARVTGRITPTNDPERSAVVRASAVREIGAADSYTASW